MERHIKLTVDVILSFDDRINDQTAINRFLNTNIRETVNGITVYDARVTKGLVGRDGISIN